MGRMEPEVFNPTPYRDLVISDHALVRFLEHGSKIDVSEYRRQLVMRRKSSGLADVPSDRALLKFLKETLPVLSYRGLLVGELRNSKVIGSNADSVYRRMPSGLVAVSDARSRRLITVMVDDAYRSAVRKRVEDEASPQDGDARQIGM